MAAAGVAGVAAPAAPEPPRWLLTAALAFWGWHSGLWWVAAPLALLAELPRVTTWRFALAARERQRVADLCTLLIALTGVWFALREPRLGTALIALIRWLPVLLFPLLAVQLYDGRRGLELSVLFLSLRGGENPLGGQVLDLRYPYLILCVIAASMTAPGSLSFLPTLALLAGYALWPFGAAGADGGGRAPGRRLALFALAAVLAVGVASGLRAAHTEAELWVMRWVEYWLGAAEDPFRATTAIGEVGRVKGSDRLRLRVWPAADGPDPARAPLLLRTASYDRYIDGTWFTSGAPFTPLLAEGDGVRLAGPAAAADAARPAPRATTRVLLALDRPEGLLPLPADAELVIGLVSGPDPGPLGGPVAGPGGKTSLQRNAFGAVRFDHRGAARLAYRVGHGVAAPLAPPDAADLRLPPREAAAIARFIEAAGLSGLDPAAALVRLRDLFARDFRYTLDLPALPPAVAPIGHFLEQARAGHCEYFATAAALVLRGLGVPTRYARGWSVQEWSAIEGTWIARERHAHAWVQVWLDGAWRDFDPTPPDWGRIEAAARPWGVGLMDRLARLRFVLSGGDGERAQTRTWLFAPLGLLVAVLAWRIARRGRRRARERPAGPRPASAPAHPFVALERALARHGRGRRADETLHDWATRLAATGEPAAATLTQAVGLYYRDRFDPAGLAAPDRQRLDRALRQLAARAANTDSGRDGPG